MKVLMINVVCGIRSTGRICTDLATVLEGQGHEVKIAYGRENIPEQFQKFAIRIGTNLDVQLHGIRTRLLDQCGFGSKRVTKRFVEWLNTYDPDIIHIHNLHGYYINIEILFDYLKRSRKKIIWTLHDCWAFTGHCSHFSNIKCEQWMNGCYQCPQKKDYPATLFVDNSKRNWELKKQLFTGVSNLSIVTPSEWLKGLVEKSFLKEYDVMAIPNGVDLSIFKPTPSDFREKYGLTNKKIILGVATAWSERKGLKEFIELSKILDNDFKVVLVGMDKNQIRKLPATILGLAKTASVKELAEIYTAADVFINAGREETMGMTTVEAMACGTPVVVSNLTAVPEVVNNEGGIIVNELTVTEIADAIYSVVEGHYNPILNATLFEKYKQYALYVKLYENTFANEFRTTMEG